MEKPITKKLDGKLDLINTVLEKQDKYVGCCIIINLYLSIGIRTQKNKPIYVGTHIFCKAEPLNSKISEIDYTRKQEISGFNLFLPVCYAVKPKLNRGISPGISDNCVCV